MVVESMTCLTSFVCDAMRCAASRAASSGTVPVRVTVPSFAVMLTEADLSRGSENILALMSVVMASSDWWLHAAATTRERLKTSVTSTDFERSMGNMIL
jgi:hypothetical protein